MTDSRQFCFGYSTRKPEIGPKFCPELEDTVPENAIASLHVLLH